MGNAVVWKPAATATLSNWHFYRLLIEAGLPPGVINFLPGDSIEVSDALLADRHLAGIHFTGSTERVPKPLAHLRGQSRPLPLVSAGSSGETGGKDFILAHPSADVDALAVGMVRGAYEYQGQKCSAASRAYIPAQHLARGARPRGRDDRRHPDGRRGGFPELHGRGDRPARVRPASATTSSARGRMRA